MFAQIDDCLLGETNKTILPSYCVIRRLTLSILKNSDVEQWDNIFLCILNIGLRS